MPLPTTQERLGSPRRQPQPPVRMFDLLRALVITGLGGYLLYTTTQARSMVIGSTARLVWGILMVAYGLYRLWDALPFASRKKSLSDDDDLR